mmetsp:Transcript_6528/g.26169  ORF Transcript_6528/g.26169 Transcript_6528/m.26169 type:complete len:269 (+) Transcript_6528:2629-3435(+)
MRPVRNITHRHAHQLVVIDAIHDVRRASRRPARQQRFARVPRQAQQSTLHSQKRPFMRQPASHVFPRHHRQHSRAPIVARDRHELRLASSRPRPRLRLHRPNRPSSAVRLARRPSRRQIPRPNASIERGAQQRRSSRVRASSSSSFASSFLFFRRRRRRLLVPRRRPVVVRERLAPRQRARRRVRASRDARDAPPLAVVRLDRAALARARDEGAAGRDRERRHRARRPLHEAPAVELEHGDDRSASRVARRRRRRASRCGARTARALR